MKLFAAQIAVIVEIIVAAENEEAAMTYLQSTREWLKDGTFDDDALGSAEPRSVRQVMSPKECPVPGDSICWGPIVEGEQFSASDAFYSIPAPGDDADEDEIDKWIKDLADNQERFIEEQNQARPF